MAKKYLDIFGGISCLSYTKGWGILELNQEKGMAETNSRAIEGDDSFTRSAGKQLALYATVPYTHMTMQTILRVLISAVYVEVIIQAAITLIADSVRRTPDTH